MSCKVALLRMQRAGLLVLPAPRGRSGNGKKAAPAQPLLTLEPAPLCLPAHHLHALRLQLVRTPLERLLYRQMMVEHHYLGYYPMPGYVLHCRRKRAVMERCHFANYLAELFARYLA